MSWSEAESWVNRRHFARDCFEKGWDPLWVYRYLVWKLGSPAFKEQRNKAIELFAWKPPGKKAVMKETLELIIEENRDLFGDYWETHEERIRRHWEQIIKTGRSCGYFPPYPTICDFDFNEDNADSNF